MTPLFAHRAAEEFDRALEGRASRSGAERHADLLGTVETLRRMPPVEARPDFVADLRTRLMTAAETDLVPAPPVVRRAAADAHPRHPRPTPPRHRRRQPGDRGRHRRHGRGRLGRPARRVALPGQAGRRGHIHGRARRRREQGPLAARPGRHTPRRGPAAPGQVRRQQRARRRGPQRLPHHRQTKAPTGCSGRTPTAPTPATSPRSATSPSSGMKSLRETCGTDNATADDVLQSADTLARLDEQAKGLCEDLRDDRHRHRAHEADLQRRRRRPRRPAVPPGHPGRRRHRSHDGRTSPPSRRSCAPRPARRRTPPTASPRAIPAAAPRTPPSTPDPGQVTSTITPGGDVVTNLATAGTTAVKGLENEVTGAVKATTKTGTPVDGVVKAVTDADRPGRRHPRRCHQGPAPPVGPHLPRSRGGGRDVSPGPWSKPHRSAGAWSVETGQLKTERRLISRE